ncbi:O-fucosyltransferase family protein [Artemisia annua]|uniref:O-fucosyltransferase family protein n=1 Tax=Artemisia annua TaxID=35608 RepID=A0A2U1M7E5_ARTAN|nr:O-fucosyltransferase family protein [Artemisia annua]
MEGVNRLRKKQTSTLLFRSNKHLLILIALFSLFIFFIFFFPNNNNSLAPNFLKTTQCFNFQKTQKFLTYAPHSGFSNQLSEFKNAVLMSVILNRTLVVPPVLDHHAVVLGSCPKFRVSDPKELRFNVWNHAIELIRTQRYVSMADVIDISSLVSESAVRVIDFRHFVSLFCDVDINYFCSKGSKMDDSLLEKLRQCGSVLSGHIGAINECVYAVEEDCRTTVWTYQKDVENGALDSFQPDEELKRKKKISFVRRRKDVYETLGPRSIADSATVLSFGTLFTSPYKGSESYIDIHEAPKDQKIQSLINKIEFLPFVTEILDAGKAYALHTIKSPFVCAQLRLLDGQFKNHRSATFQGLKQKLDSLRQKESLPIHIFVMTDLPVSNWTGTYLGDLANDSDSIKLFLLSEDDELIKRAAKKVLDEGHGWNFGAFSSDGIKNVCHRRQKLPDILLHVEETVCSCASLGFVGTAGSTIADSIEMMRKKQFCSR